MLGPSTNIAKLILLIWVVARHFVWVVLIGVKTIFTFLKLLLLVYEDLINPKWLRREKIPFLGYSQE